MYFMSLIFIGQMFSTAKAAPPPLILDTKNIKYNYGDFGPEDACPEGTYAFGLQLKVDKQHRLNDGSDSAVNGVRLHCANISFPNRQVASIQSKVGDKGIWFGSHYCDQGFLTGFRVKFGNREDELYLAATSVEVTCSNGVALEGDGVSIGEYEDHLRCRKTLAICAIQTQVNSERGYSLGVNNVRMKCCKTPNPALACSPNDHWEDVLVCDNIAAAAKSPPLLCRYRQSIGIAESNLKSSTKYEEKEVQNSLGYSATLAIGPLSMGIREEIETSDVTGTDWEEEDEDTFESETVVSTDVEVPSGSRVRLRQAVATCGLYQVSASEIQKIDESFKYLK